MHTKKCSRCKQTKNTESFSWRNKDKNILDSWCRICKKEYHQSTKTLCKIRKRKHKRLKQKRMIEYLIKNPCKVCGETDPIVLDFHHTDPSTKEDDVSSMFSHGASWNRIEREIRKCKVLCCKCHRKLTAKESGWQAFVDSVLLGIPVKI